MLARPRFTHQVVIGEIDFESNLRLLEAAPTSIGVAPLETISDEETLDFIAGKSDLKILLFAGYGHPPVVSASPPYTESPLQDAAFVVGNSYSEWSEALEYQYREGWKAVADHARRIQNERGIDRVTRESWVPALQAVRLAEPISGIELPGLAGRSRAAPAGKFLKPPQSLEAEEIRQLHSQVAELRESLSWKVTAPLRAIAKPLMERRGPGKRPNGQSRG